MIDQEFHRAMRESIAQRDAIRESIAQREMMREAVRERHALRERDAMRMATMADMRVDVGVIGQDLLAAGERLRAWNLPMESLAREVMAWRRTQDSVDALWPRSWMQRAHDDAARAQTLFELANRTLALDHLAHRALRVPEAFTVGGTAIAELLRAADRTGESAVFRAADALRDAHRPLGAFASALDFWRSEAGGAAARARQDYGLVERWLTEQTALERQLKAMRELAMWSAPFQHEVRAAAALESWADPARLALRPLAFRTSALVRTSEVALHALGRNTELFASLPPQLRASGVLAPHWASRAVDRLSSTAEVEAARDDADESEETQLVRAAAVTTPDERLASVAGWDPRLAELLHAARLQLARREADYSAHVCVTLRRVIHFALDRAAPTAEVSAWRDPRLQRRDDGRGPTQGSRVLFALRGLGDGRDLARMAEAQRLVVEGIMAHVNGPIHLDDRPSDHVVLSLMLDQAEMLILWFAHSAGQDARTA